MNTIYARSTNQLKLVLPRGEAQRGNTAHEPGKTQLWAALCATSVPMLIVDESDRIQLVSVGAEQLFGESSGDLRCGSLWDHLSSVERAPNQSLLAQVQAGLRRIDLVFFDGTTRRAKLETLADARGIATHVRFEIIIESRRSAPLGRTLDVVGRIAGGLAHDVNNQLSAALNCVYLLRRHMPQDETLATHLHELQSALWRAATLAAGAKRLPHPAASKPCPTSLNDTVTGLVPLLRHLGRNVDIEVRLQPDLPSLHAPIAELEQVILATVLFSIRRATGTRGCLWIESSTVAGTNGATATPSVRLLCTLRPTDAASTSHSMPIASQVDGGRLRRALKRCGAHAGHDELRVWIDFAVR